MKPVAVESTTLKALMLEGRREWFITEPWFYLLLALIFVDIVLGFMRAYRAEDVSSNAFFAGLKKKTAMILIVAALVMLDPFVPGLTLSVIATVAYVSMELLSITETAAKLGAPVPEAVTRVLRTMREAEAQPVKVVASVSIDTNVKSSSADPVHTVTEDKPL